MRAERIGRGAFAVALALCASCPDAQAFPTGDRFDPDPGAPSSLPLMLAAGDGIDFTGAPGFATGVCSACHTGGPGRAGVKLGADDATLFTSGYRPGNVYQLEVSLIGESLGLDRNGPARCGNVKGKGFVPCNSNGFSIEPTDAVGASAGTLCPVLPAGGGCPSPRGATTVLAANTFMLSQRGFLDPDAKNPAGLENGGTRWRFFWQAPSGDAGPITFHIGVVDGNGGTGTADFPQDVDGDDTVEAHISVPAYGGAPISAGTACGVGGTRSTARPSLVLLVGLAVLAARRRRSR